MGVKKLRERSKEKEQIARRQLAGIIFEAGEEGISAERFFAEKNRRKVGRVGYRNDVEVVLTMFRQHGMINIVYKNDRGASVVDKYVWVGKDIGDYEF